MHFKPDFFYWTFLFVKTPNKDDNEKAQYFNAFLIQDLFLLS